MPAQPPPPRPPACPPPSQGSPRTPAPAHSPVLGVGTLDVLALLQVGLQVHLEEGWAAGVVRTSYRPVVTAVLVVPGGGRAPRAESPEAPCLSAPGGWGVGAEGGTYLRALSLMVNGHPRGSTSKTGGFPPPATRQPCLQWMKSSPICSATAMLFTTTVSLAWSTGHFSAGEDMLTPRSTWPPPALATLLRALWPGCAGVGD